MDVSPKKLDLDKQLKYLREELVTFPAAHHRGAFEVISATLFPPPLHTRPTIIFVQCRAV